MRLPLVCCITDALGQWPADRIWHTMHGAPVTLASCFPADAGVVPGGGHTMLLGSGFKNKGGGLLVYRSPDLLQGRGRESLLRGRSQGAQPCTALHLRLSSNPVRHGRHRT